MKLHQVLTGATNTFDDKAAIDVGSVEDHPFTVSVNLVIRFSWFVLGSESMHTDDSRWSYE